MVQARRRYRKREESVGMKIKKLEIAGFKSFVDRSVVVFDHAITGIVGPNGCGKSNIVDAIRWVMGEQSAKNLRGRAMEDVIFNGSESRGPHGFAEVSVTFDNTDGLTPPEYREYAEITVTRRLDRDGRSDYLINRAPVRLLDVTNLFLGTGVGKRAYSIIEQGRIGFIVSSKPVDRRHLIEEAAGVTKFKARKRAAERKMDQTRQNLLRVSDIIQEIERTLASLKRQAQKAERYKRYRGEIRDLELHVATHRWLELVATHRVASSELSTEAAESEGRRKGLGMREAEVDLARSALGALESEAEKAHTHAFETENSLQLLQSRCESARDRLVALREAEEQLAHETEVVAQRSTALADERQQVTSSLEQLEKREADAAAALDEAAQEQERRRAAAHAAEVEVAAFRDRLADCDTRIARAEAVLTQLRSRDVERRARLESLRVEREAAATRLVEIGHEASALEARFEALRSGKEQTASQRADLEQELEGFLNEIRTSDDIVDSLRERLTERRSRLRSLEEILRRFEGVGAGVRSLMKRYASDAEREAAGIVGLLSDRLECSEEWTEALAGALGDRLQHVVVRSVEEGRGLLETLREAQAGRATVLPLSPRIGRERDRVHTAVPDARGVVGRMLDLVSCADTDRTLVEHLLGEVLVVEDLPAALAIFGEGAWDGMIATRAGEVLSADGSLTGGGGEAAGAHHLSVMREVRELRGTVADLETEHSAAQERHGTLRAAIASRNAALEGARTEAHDAELSIVETTKDLKTARDEAEQIGHRNEQLDQEIGQLSSVIELGEEEEAARQEIEQANDARGMAVAELARAEEILAGRRVAVDEQSSRVTEQRVQAAQAKERAEGDRAAMERLHQTMEELEARRTRLVEDARRSAAQEGTLRGQLFETSERQAETAEAVEKARSLLADARRSYEDARAAVGEQEDSLKELRVRLDASSKRMNELALREKELAMELQHLVGQIDDRHRVELTAVVGDYHDRDVPDATIHDRIDELSRLIERMGEINLTAIEEFEEKSTRHEYLTGQRDDLEEALRQLDRAIRQMNRESKRLFTDAFAAVNERFKRVFPTMFGGGRAELRLTEPDDILESGVEIIAQPPGKRLGSLELMSGGEKALTAVSLIFAIFQYKPSPFCLLDEVDAPLDEANIGRFADAVHQMTDRSQFILITHAKRTMESTDVLYGVTMEEPGVSKLVSVEMRGESRRGLRARAAVA